MRLAAVALAFVCSSCLCAHADVIVSGYITQSTEDGTGPATNNPSLNNIQTLQAFTLRFDSDTPITGPGMYSLVSSSLLFDVPDAPASEGMFGTSSLTVTADGAFADFSLFACVSGSDCFTGNSLGASFQIPLASLTALNVATTGLDQPHPFDLLEDDGVTDIQGQITTYSNTAVVATPEPSSGSLLALAVACTGTVALFRNQRTASTRRIS